MRGKPHLATRAALARGTPPWTPGIQKAMARSGSNSRQLTKTISARVSDEEWSSLDRKAAEAGLTLSDYLRAAALSCPPLRRQRRPRPDTVLLSDILAHLGRIGSNVNQLAHHANAGGIPSTDALNGAQCDIRRARDAVLDALGIHYHKRGSE